MDILRDPIWQFVGAIFAAIAIIPLLWQGWRLITRSNQGNTSSVNPNAQPTKPISNQHIIDFEDADVSAGGIYAGDENLPDTSYTNATSREHRIRIKGGKVATEGDIMSGNVQLNNPQKKHR